MSQYQHPFNSDQSSPSHSADGDGHIWLLISLACVAILATAAAAYFLIRYFFLTPAPIVEPDVFRKGMGFDAIHCSICLEPFVEGENGVSTLPVCGHIFHRDCIVEWLTGGGTFCPVCHRDCDVSLL